MKTLLLIFLLISLATSLPPRKISLCHPDDEFACKNGSCIPAEWKCDNIPDCPDREDENECHYLHECLESEFMCRSGECLPKAVKCDGHFNCSDGSDERGCEQKKSTSTSTLLLPRSLSLCHPDDEFTCKNGLCIPAEWKCDNIPDCSDGEDERECHYLHQCYMGEFMCLSGECLPKAVKCDGHDDCLDGSDERGCEQNKSTPTSTLLPHSLSLCHPDDEFTCKNGSCIPAEWKCDNIPDCSDGEDESECLYLHQCLPHFYMCLSGECLLKEVKCDGHYDCVDGSDERGCGTIKYEKMPDDNLTTTLPVHQSSSYGIILIICSIVLLLFLLMIVSLPHQLRYRRDLVFNQIASVFRKFVPFASKPVNKGPIISPASSRMHPPLANLSSGIHNPSFSSPLLNQ